MICSVHFINTNGVKIHGVPSLLELGQSKKWLRISISYKELIQLCAATYLDDTFFFSQILESSELSACCINNILIPLILLYAGT